MKVLIIRFSSIGDIVLTTPVVKALKTQRTDVVVHYLTKKKFAEILNNNPYIDQLYTLDDALSEIIHLLKKEKYDLIIDLHHNARTFLIKKKLGVKSYSFPKLNIRKWLLVKFKLNTLPDVHVVDRYFEAVQKMGIVNDKEPCDYFISEANKVDVSTKYQLQPKTYLSIAIGAQFATKRMPLEKLIEIVDQIEYPIILVGGPEDHATGDALVKHFKEKQIINTCGKHSLSQSAAIVKQSSALLTNDTGMMHIASCFQLPIVSVWGNTVPALGMYPYYPKNERHSIGFTMHEVPQLNCRPCSKIGYSKCPKGHFRCMLDQNSEAIAADVIRFVKISSDE